MNHCAPIGIFDSGIGGLTVVKEIQRIMPKEDLIYVGDTARVPYGSRQPEEIIAFLQQILRFLQTKQVKMAVIACNTMTAYGYEQVRRVYPFLLTPMNTGMTDAILASKSKKIGVIATQRTIQNQMHRKAAEKLANTVAVYGKACQDFVPLIENGQITGIAIEQAAMRYLEFFQNSGIDTLILGCTHYPLIGQVVQQCLGENIRLINPAQATAIDAQRALQTGRLLNDSNGQGYLKMYFSADLAKARRMANLVLAADLAEVFPLDLTEYVQRV